MYIFLVIMYSSIYVGGKDLPKFSKITKLRYFYNDQGKPNCSCLILSIIIPNYELYNTIFYIPACLPYFPFLIFTKFCWLEVHQHHLILLTAIVLAASGVITTTGMVTGQSSASQHYMFLFARLSQIQNKNTRSKTISTASLATHSKSLSCSAGLGVIRSHKLS